MFDFNKTELKGLGLKGDDFKQGRVLTQAWQPRLEYAWDNGVGVGRYLAGLKNGEIIGRRCNKCGRDMIPPRMFCELCFRPTDEWVTAKDTGVVKTFAISHVNWDASRLKPGETPHMPAVIDIDGLTKGMGILHLLGEVDPKDVKIGMKVRAVWKDARDREGAITDIKYFRPI